MIEPIPVADLPPPDPVVSIEAFNRAYDRWLIRRGFNDQDNYSKRSMSAIFQTRR